MAKPLPAVNRGSSTVLLTLQSMSSRSRSPCKKLKVCVTQVEFIFFLSDLNCSYPFISDFYRLHNYPLINLGSNLRHILDYIFFATFMLFLYTKNKIKSKKPQTFSSEFPLFYPCSFIFKYIFTERQLHLIYIISSLSYAYLYLK